MGSVRSKNSRQMTDAEKESTLNEQDRLELQKFRRDVKDDDKALAIEFKGSQKHLGDLQVFEEIGRQGVVFNTYGFISDEAVDLANAHLKSIIGEDEDG